VPWYLVIVTPIVGIILTIWARHRDVLEGTVLLQFDDPSDSYKNLQRAIAQVGLSERVWRVETEEVHGDWKRHAGATASVERSLSIPFRGQLPRVKTNVDLPVFPAGRQRLYFLPNQILVVEGSNVGAVDYDDFRMTLLQDVRFSESDQPPSEAERLGTTWQYVNRSGGPDRRFSSNREIPIMRYAQFEFRSGAGLHLLYLCSKVDSPPALANALQAMITKPAAS